MKNKSKISVLTLLMAIGLLVALFDEDTSFIQYIILTVGFTVSIC